MCAMPKKTNLEYVNSKLLNKIIDEYSFSDENHVYDDSFKGLVKGDNYTENLAKIKSTNEPELLLIYASRQLDSVDNYFSDSRKILYLDTIIESLHFVELCIFKLNSKKLNDSHEIKLKMIVDKFKSLVSRVEDVIIEKKKKIYYVGFAERVKTANVEKLQKAVEDSRDLYVMLDFTKNVQYVNYESMKNAIEKIDLEKLEKLSQGSHKNSHLAKIALHDYYLLKDILDMKTQSLWLGFFI